MARRKDRVLRLDATHPSHYEFGKPTREGCRRGVSPMAIVWPCSLTAHDYVAAGRSLVVPRPDCPSCKEAMIFFGSYTRPLRLGTELRLVIRRARCRPCSVTHALLPDFVAILRLDGVEVIGKAIEQIAGGMTTRHAADASGLPYTTVRGWRRRFAERGGLLASGFLAAAVALGELVGLSPSGVIAAALYAMGLATTAARRRLGATGSLWRIANRICGGQLLCTNTSQPWMCA